MEFEGGLTAAFSMVAFTESICQRRTTIYGSKVGTSHIKRYTLEVLNQRGQLAGGDQQFIMLFTK